MVQGRRPLCFRRGFSEPTQAGIQERASTLADKFRVCFSDLIFSSDWLRKTFAVYKNTESSLVTCFWRCEPSRIPPSLCIRICDSSACIKIGNVFIKIGNAHFKIGDAFIRICDACNTIDNAYKGVYIFGTSPSFWLTKALFKTGGKIAHLALTFTGA